MTPAELIAALTESRQRLEAALAGLSVAQLTQPGAMDDWTVKDLLSHLTAWEAETVTHIARSKRGLKPRGLPQTDAAVDQMNDKLYRENRDRPLDRVLADWRGVRKQMIRQAEALTEKDLGATPAWLKGRSLLAFILEDTIEHEAEHLPQIEAWKRGPAAGA